MMTMRMKKILLTAALITLASTTHVSCGDEAEENTPRIDSEEIPFTYTIIKVPYTVKGISFNMIKVEGCTFGMGHNSAMTDEAPWHLTTLSDYYISETEVTQELYQAVMGNNQSYFIGNKRPVDYCSWDDAYAFVSKLSTLTGQPFRLPTEAEWECAAKGGIASKNGTNFNHHYYKYSGSDNIDDVGWCKTNSDNETHDVATKLPNELGIYDMSGNVKEWCSDWYGNYGSEEEVTSPKGPASGPGHVHRGGSWWNVETYCRNTYRDYLNSSSDVNGAMYGIRLCLSASE